MHAPGDAAFDPARRPWNLAIGQEPLAVVQALDAGDVEVLVRWAAREGIPVAAQPTGHGASGRATGAVLLRTDALDTLEIDPGARTARVGAGVRSGDLQRAAAAHGLTGMPGSSPTVSVAGAVLGGGLSWFGRAFGWIAESALAFEVVDAEGRARTVSASEDPDLFWALRGGGGEVAIVTAITLQLHPAPAVTGGRMLWPARHERQVAAAFQAMSAVAPEALTLWFARLHFPGGEPLVAIDSAFLGPEAEARALMREAEGLPTPLADTRGALSVAELGGITGDPLDPSPGMSRAELLAHFDADVLLAEPIAPLMTVQVRHLGGALSHPGDTPHGALTEPYVAYLFGSPTDDAHASAIGEKQASLAAQLPTTGRKPVSFLAPNETLADALPTGSVERIAALKAERDPAGIIRANIGLPG